MHSGAIWNVKYQDLILNKIISCGYNDAWVVTPRSKVTTVLEETNDETMTNHNNKKWDIFLGHGFFSECLRFYVVTVSVR